MPSKVILDKAKSLKVPFGCHVYFLLRDGLIVYVGKSNKLLSRIGTHQSDKHFDEVKFILVTAEDQDLLEMGLIKALRPEYNLQKSGRLSAAESEVLTRYAFEEAIIHAAVRAQPKITGYRYGFVGFFSDGQLLTGLYDDDDDFEESDHVDDCKYLAAVHALKEVNEAQDEMLSDFCQCKAKAVVLSDFHHYYTVPLAELYDLSGEGFDPFRTAFEKEYVQQFEELRNGSKETEERV